VTDYTRVLHISTHDAYGGAARSAQRIHRALADSGLASRMRVLHRATSDESVRGGEARQSINARIVNKLRDSWRSMRQRGWYTDNPVLHSFGQVSAGLVNELIADEATVINLHWVSEMLSIRDIGRLNKPVVWTLHDMWAFCGGEHFAPDDAAARFRVGYRADNRPLGERGPDLNRRTWDAKRRAWANQRFTIVSPSHWLADCARQSVLFADAAIHVIFYPLDTANVWRPIAPEVARIALGLPLEKKLILMGAQGGVADPRKGGDLLRDALGRVVTHPSNVALIVYGQSAPRKEQNWPCEVHWLGEVTDDRILALANSAADVVVVPSRQDNLPNTAVEAQACGTPVVGFDIGGLPDIVAHRETGWLAKPFNTADLAKGILWVLDDGNRRLSLKRAARERAVERFAPQIIAKQYSQLYEQLLQTTGVSRLSDLRDREIARPQC
jgi:glycosyltransferase involved in cell wall biosynthesis